MLHLYSLLGILPVLPLLTAAPHPAPLPAGETVADAYPPTGTAVDTALFPGRTDVGYPHVTRTGAAPFAFVTAPAAQFPEVQGSFGPVFLPVAKDVSRSEARERQAEKECLVADVYFRAQTLTPSTRSDTCPRDTVCPAMRGARARRARSSRRSVRLMPCIW
jgi:hypothetical protein